MNRTDQSPEVVLTRIKYWIKYTLCSGWHLRRYLISGLGIFVSIQAYLLRDPVLGILAAYFLYQAITNTGCFGRSCYTPLKNPQHTDGEEQAVCTKIKKSEP